MLLLIQNLKIKTKNSVKLNSPIHKDFRQKIVKLQPLKNLKDESFLENPIKYDKNHNITQNHAHMTTDICDFSKNRSFPVLPWIYMSMLNR